MVQVVLDNGLTLPADVAVREGQSTAKLYRDVATRFGLRLGGFRIYYDGRVVDPETDPVVTHDLLTKLHMRSAIPLRVVERLVLLHLGAGKPIMGVKSGIKLSRLYSLAHSKLGEGASFRITVDDVPRDVPDTLSENDVGVFAPSVVNVIPDDITAATAEGGRRRRLRRHT